MNVTCPECAKPINLPDQNAGRLTRCPACDTQFRAVAQPQRAASAARQTVHGGHSTALLLAVMGMGVLIGITIGITGTVLLVHSVRPGDPVTVALPPAAPRPLESHARPPTALQPAEPPVRPPTVRPAKARTEEEEPIRPTRAPVPSPAALTVGVDDLFAAYQQDLAKADVTYLGKILVLTGVRGKVEKNERGQYFIGASMTRMVRAPQTAPRVVSIEQARRQMQEAVLNTRYEPGVLILLRDDAIAGFVGLDEQKPISVRGQCRGTKPDLATVPPYFVVIEEAVPAQ
jgi:hypothetical protein